MAARTFLLVAMIVVWQAVGTSVSRALLPPFSEVVIAFYGLATLQTIPTLPWALLVTLSEILLAFGIATCLGIALALALESNKVLKGAFLPAVTAIFSTPHIILFPLAIVLFGLGIYSKVAYGVLAGFPVITLGVLAAFAQVNPSTLDVGRSMGARGTTLFTKIVLPASLSTIAGTLRVGFGLVVVTTIVGEMLGSLDGLGFYLRTEFETFRTADYLAVVVLVIILVLGLNAAASYFEKRAKKWSRAK